MVRVLVPRALAVVLLAVAVDVVAAAEDVELEVAVLA